MRAGIDDDFGAAELADGSVVYRNFHGLWPNEASGAGDKFRSGLFVIGEIRFIPSRLAAKFDYGPVSYPSKMIARAGVRIFGRMGSRFGRVRGVELLV